ncbi:hypothetical protein EBT31_13460, partial [bacterium]|nr:hypothetical protein [bacterium]
RSRFRKHIHGVSVRPTFIQSAGGDALGDILVDLAWTDHQHFEKAFRSLHAVLQKLGILRHTTRLTRS